MCVPGIDCTDASEIPKQYKAWLDSIRQGLKKPVESGNEMSAVTTTAAIQLEMDNTFAPMLLCSVSSNHGKFPCLVSAVAVCFGAEFSPINCSRTKTEETK